MPPPPESTDDQPEEPRADRPDRGLHRGILVVAAACTGALPRLCMEVRRRFGEGGLRGK